MTDHLVQTLSEPGFWVLCALVLFAAINLAASFLLKAARRRLLHLVYDISTDDRLTQADKAWLRFEVGNSKGHHLLIASPFAPFAILGAVALGLHEGWQARERGSLLSVDAQADRLNRRSDRMHAKSIENHTGIDPTKGHFWSDPRRQEIRELAFQIETWSNPIAMVWIIAWLGISAPLLLIGYLLAGSIQPFVKNLWEPMREPIEAALRLAQR